MTLIKLTRDLLQQLMYRRRENEDHYLQRISTTLDEFLKDNVIGSIPNDILALIGETWKAQEYQEYYQSFVQDL